jgi:spore cortex formation protein SpoVR/YcgB (stage V sporulation)
VIPGSHRMNPYHIGWYIWKDVYRRWETPTGSDRINWGRRGGEGLQKLFEIRDTEDDVSFIANYLTDELIAELKLYRYQWAEDVGDETIYEVMDVPDAEGYERIRMAAMMQVGHNMFPMLRVVDANYYQDRTLVLEHVPDGRDLKVFEPELPLDDVRAILKQKGNLTSELIADTGEVLKHIWKIWRNPIILRTVYDESPLFVYCDRDGRIKVDLDDPTHRIRR